MTLNLHFTQLDLLYELTRGEIIYIKKHLNLSFLEYKYHMREEDSELLENTDLFISYEIL